METHEAYEHKYLDNPDSMIRLLKIVSVSPQISCAIGVFTLEHLPAYITLSYTWGDLQVVEPIDIEGKALHITSTLASALGDVYLQWQSSLTDAGSEQWLWADGICINQANDEEKNHQVPLMEAVFSGAVSMFSWIGNNEDTEGIIESINLVADEISQLPNYSLVMADLQDSLFPTNAELKSLQEKHEPRILREFTDLTWLEKLYITRRKQNHEVEILFKVFQLFDQPYWSRVWILQELVLGQDVIVLRGLNTVSYVTTCRVFSWIMTVQLHLLLHEKPDTMPKTEWMGLLHWTNAAHLATIALFKTRRKRNAIDGLHAVDHQSQSGSGQQLRPLAEDGRKSVQYNLQYFSVSYTATNPKDCIYGMAGITGCRVISDYSSKTTVARVYQDFVVRYLDTLLEEDSDRVSDFCVLWFLTLAGSGFARQGTPGLPSWAPDFAGVTNDRPNSCFFWRRGRSDKGAWGQDIRLPKLEDPNLRCMAVLVDQVCLAGPPLITYQCFFENDVESEAWLLWLPDLVVGLTALNRSPAGYDLFLAISKALSEKKCLLTEEELKLMSDLLIVDLEYVCESLRGFERERFVD
jgi:hypothetical protein